jgi:uncharacterized protein GlcG (DUF336 family)
MAVAQPTRKSILEPAAAAALQVKMMRGLSLDEANTIIAASFAAAKKRNCRPMSAVVLDAGGRVKAFQKQDCASMLRFEICCGKAYGALALMRSLSIHKSAPLVDPGPNAWRGSRPQCGPDGRVRAGGKPLKTPNPGRNLRRRCRNWQL